MTHGTKVPARYLPGALVTLPGATPPLRGAGLRYADLGPWEMPITVRHPHSRQTA